jgi:hypothetical protein
MIGAAVLRFLIGLPGLFLGLRSHSASDIDALITDWAHKHHRAITASLVGPNYFYVLQ